MYKKPGHQQTHSALLYDTAKAKVKALKYKNNKKKLQKLNTGA